MVLVFPVYTLHVHPFWVLLLYFGMDTFRTIQGEGVMEGADGVNFVAHGAGFLAGLGTGAVALLQGVMRRYDKLSNGSGWWGYWPVSLEEDDRRARLRAQQLQRLREQTKAPRADRDQGWPGG